MNRGSDFLNEAVAEHSDLVRDVAEQLAAYHRDLGTVLGIITEEDPNYYHAYPFLFRNAFPAVSDADLCTLAIAGVFYLNHLCLLDDVVDSSVAPPPYKLFLSAILHEEALLRLGTIFPAGSPFWAELSSYHREFATTMLREQTLHTRRLTPFSADEIFQMAKGKAALSKMTTSALAVLANKPGSIPRLSASQDGFNAARQLYDDVKDWKDDFAHQRYSSLLTGALLQLQNESLQQGQGTNHSVTPTLESLSATLHYGGHIESALTQAAAWCDEALQQVEGDDLPGWKRLLHDLRSQVLRLRDDLSAIRQPSGSSFETAAANRLQGAA